MNNIKSSRYNDNYTDEMLVGGSAGVCVLIILTLALAWYKRQRR